MFCNRVFRRYSKAVLLCFIAVLLINFGCTKAEESDKSLADEGAFLSSKVLRRIPGSSGEILRLLQEDSITEKQKDKFKDGAGQVVDGINKGRGELPFVKQDRV